MHPQLQELVNKHPVNVRHMSKRSLGERVADTVAARVGSWPFILTQSGGLALWIIYNGYVAIRVMSGHSFDPYPFILLNLALSFQAAYTGPIVMMSQNRQASKDRDLAEHDFDVNQRAFQHLIWQNEQLMQLLQALKTEPTGPAPASEINNAEN